MKDMKNDSLVLKEMVALKIESRKPMVGDKSVYSEVRLGKCVERGNEQ